MSDIKIGLPELGNTSLVDLQLRSEMQNLQKLSQQTNTGAKGKANSAAIEKAAQQFEGLLMQQMLKSMWETVPEGGILSGSQEEQHYRDMLNQAYADELSKGQGIGIKEVITKELLAKKDNP